jgi:hypothetical protein
MHGKQGDKFSSIWAVQRLAIKRQPLDQKILNAKLGHAARKEKPLKFDKI